MPGDAPFVLVAMNPAALRVHLPALEPAGIAVVNEDEFTPGNLEKAGYKSNPLDDGPLEASRVIAVPMTQLNESAVEHNSLPHSERARCKNFFALGLMLSRYDRPLQPLLEWLMKRFGKRRTPATISSWLARSGRSTPGCETRFIALMPCGPGAALFATDYLSADEALARLKDEFDFLGEQPGNGVGRSGKWC